MKKYLLDSKYSMLRMLIGVILGIVFGLTIPKNFYGIGDVLILLGDLFMNALKAVAPILVFILILTSLMKKQEKQDGIKRIIVLFMVTTFIAGLVGILISEVHPISLNFEGVKASQNKGITDMGKLFTNLLISVVSNPVESLLKGDYLSILFWSALLGLALRGASDQTKEVFDNIADALMKIVQWVIMLAPIGVIGLIYKPLAESGLDKLVEYVNIIILLVVAMLVTMLIVFPIIIAILLRQNPYPIIFYCLKNSALNAFLTRSSAANIPVNLTCCEKLELNKSDYSVSIPLGSTINMAGAAITIVVMTLACCHTFGIKVSFPMMLVLALIATVSAAGASGVASGSLLLIPLACGLFGINASVASSVVGIGFIISLVQDSFETALNSSGDLLFTAVGEWMGRMRKGEKINIKAIVNTAKER